MAMQCLFGENRGLHLWGHCKPSIDQVGGYRRGWTFPRDLDSKMIDLLIKGCLEAASERTNVPGSSERTRTLFHHPH